MMRHIVLCFLLSCFLGSVSYGVVSSRIHLEGKLASATTAFSESETC